MNKAHSIEGNKVCCSNAYNAQKNKDKHSTCRMQMQIPGYVFFIVNGGLS